MDTMTAETDSGIRIGKMHSPTDGHEATFCIPRLVLDGVVHVDCHLLDAVGWELAEWQEMWTVAAFYEEWES